MPYKSSGRFFAPPGIYCQNVI